MQTLVPEKLLKIIEDIDEQGDANLTRLTVLKKWFEKPGRLMPFAQWIASRASSRKGKTKGEAAELFREARKLLEDNQEHSPKLDQASAERLHSRLVALSPAQSLYPQRPAAALHRPETEVVSAANAGTGRCG